MILIKGMKINHWCWLPSYPWFEVAQALKFVINNTTFYSKLEMVEPELLELTEWIRRGEQTDGKSAKNSIPWLQEQKLK